MSVTAKNLVRMALMCAFLPLMAACAQGPMYTSVHDSEPVAAADQGRIYLYRPASMFGAAIHPAIMLDGVNVGDSVPGGYFFIDKPAGTYKISSTTEKEESIELTIAPGQVRYVRFRASMGVLIGHVIPAYVDTDRGSREIKDCHYTTR